MHIPTFFRVVLAAGCGCGSATLRAAEPGVGYKVNAAFLLNFARSIIWPGDSGSNTFPLCIVGTDPFGETLTGSEAHEIGGEKIELPFPAATAEDLGQCRMLFISQSDKRNVSRMIILVNGKPLAAVSDVEGFADLGGICQFRDLRGRVCFECIKTKANEQGLGISSPLLNLRVDVL